SGDNANAIAFGLLQAAKADPVLPGLGFTFAQSGSQLFGTPQNTLIVNGPGPYSITGSSTNAAKTKAGSEIITSTTTGTPLGTVDGDAHARNASVIVANNGDIFDLVGTGGKDSGGFLTFNYDTGVADPNGTEYVYQPGKPGYIYDPLNKAATATTNYY